MSLRTLATFLVAIAIGLTTQTAFAAPTTPPVANNDAATTPVNTPVLIAVLANDMAASGNPIDPTSVKVELPPRSGVTALQSGQVRYTPASGFVGEDSFTYTVKGTRVIVLSSVALTLLATPREGAVQPLPASDTRLIVGSGLGDQSRGISRGCGYSTGIRQPSSAPLGSFIAFTQNPPPLGSFLAFDQRFRGWGAGRGV